PGKTGGLSFCFIAAGALIGFFNATLDTGVEDAAEHYQLNDLEMHYTEQCAAAMKENKARFRNGASRGMGCGCMARTLTVTNHMRSRADARFTAELTAALMPGAGQSREEFIAEVYPKLPVIGEKHVRTPDATLEFSKSISAALQSCSQRS
ncbi:MAG: hypothetical protein AAGJ85_09120, partial [Pseudomonadota bacterium]